MTTWISSSSIHHPWSTKPSVKRKLSDSPSPASSPSASPPSGRAPSPPQKRRRYSALEVGFSTLTLTNHSADPGSSSALPYVSEPISTPSNFLAMVDDRANQIPTVVLPSTIQEPSIPEVKMKSSSWYEPEPDRIVITDLESSSDEEENPDTDITISPALLQKISSRSRDLTGPGVPLPSTSHALVLFKPLPLPGSGLPPAVEERAENTTSPNRSDIAEGVKDDDAMDVEPY